MFRFLVLHSLSIDQTLGQRLPGISEPSWKNDLLWDKNTFCQCSLWNPMRSL